MKRTRPIILMLLVCVALACVAMFAACTPDPSENPGGTEHQHTLTKTEASDPTCVKEGNTAYWHCDGCGKYFADADGEEEIALSSTVVAKTEHELKKHDAEQANCKHGGVQEYYQCEQCEKIFTDPDGKTETTLDKLQTQTTAHILTEHPAQPHTCTDDGTIRYWQCSVCDKKFSDNSGKDEVQNVTDPAAHSPVEYPEKEATCAANGNIRYWQCSVCSKYFDDDKCSHEIQQENTVTKAKHNLQEYPAKDPTCTEDGNKRYYKCKTCNAYFNDDAGLDPTDEQSVTLQSSGHSYNEDKYCPKCGSIEAGTYTDLSGNGTADEPYIITGAGKYIAVVKGGKEIWYKLANAGLYTITPEATQGSSVSAEFEVQGVKFASAANIYRGAEDKLVKVVQTEADYVIFSTQFKAGECIEKITKDGTNLFDIWTVDAAGNPDKDAGKGWYDYASAGTYQGEIGVPTLVTDGEKHLEFKKASRFELFYVKSGDTYVHLGDRIPWEGESAAAAPVMGYEYNYQFVIASDGKFALEFLGLSGCTPDGVNVGNYLVFDGTEITLGHLANNVAAKATAANSLTDGNKHIITIGYMRASFLVAEFTLSVDGNPVTFVNQDSVAGAYVLDGKVQLSDANGFGQRLSVVPLNKGEGYSTVNLYGLDITYFAGEPAEHTITVKDGSATTQNHKAGESVKFVQGDVIGYRIEGRTYRFASYDTADFLMPNRNVTITLLHKSEVVSSGNGRLNFATRDTLTATAGNGYEIGGSGGGGHTKWAKGEVDGNEVLVVTIIDACTNGTPFNSCGRVLTYYPTRPGLTVKYSYTFINLGDNDLEFIIFVQGSGSDREEPVPMTVSIQKGQTVTVDITKTYTSESYAGGVGDNHFLTYFRDIDEADAGGVFAVYVDAQVLS